MLVWEYKYLKTKKGSREFCAAAPCLSKGLLRVTLNQVGSDRFQVPKEPSASMIGSGGELELRGRSASRVVAVGNSTVGRTDGPDSIDCYGVAGGILEKAIEFTSGEVIGGDISAGF